MYRRTFHYSVEGLDKLGAPSKSLLTRGLSAVGRGAGDFALTMLSGGADDSSDDKAPEADHLVFGPSGSSLAVRAVSGLSPGGRQNRLWALTSHRLVIAHRVVVEQAPAEPEPKSLLGKAIGFGKDIGKILTDNRLKFGENVEGEPVAVPEYRVVAEIPRAQIANVQSGPSLRVVLVDGSGFEFLLDPPVAAQNKLVAKELTKHWLRRGENLVLGLPPVLGYVGGVVGGSLHVPWSPVGTMPPLSLDKLRWPLPAPASPPDWIDDPTLGYWVEAPAPSALAVQLADHFAFGRGNGRLAVSDQRVAVVYPTHLFEAKPSSVFTTFAEIPRNAVRLETPHVGASLPAQPIVRLAFADGSRLDLRQP